MFVTDTGRSTRLDMDEVNERLLPILANQPLIIPDGMRSTERFELILNGDGPARGGDLLYVDAQEVVQVRQLAKLLRLAPDDHTEQVFKQILGACQSVVESLGALRNKLGDAHSLGPLRARPSPRHAALAVTLSGGMATFLVETWQARKAETA